MKAHATLTYEDVKAEAYKTLARMNLGENTPIRYVTSEEAGRIMARLFSSAFNGGANARSRQPNMEIVRTLDDICEGMIEPIMMPLTRDLSTGLFVLLTFLTDE